MSAKRKALMQTLSPERLSLKEQVGECMLCCRRLEPEHLDVHEIASGPAREACLEQPSLQLVLCRGCHERVQSWPAAKQIAQRHRWMIVRECKLYCELKGRAPTAVIANDVEIYMVFGSKGKK
jgi:hypothetical protein